MVGNALTSTNVTYSRQQPLHPAGLQAPGAAALLPPSVPGQVCRSLGLTLCCPLVFPGRSAGPWGQRCAAPWCSFSFIEKSSTPPPPPLTAVLALSLPWVLPWVCPWTVTATMATSNERWGLRITQRPEPGRKLVHPGPCAFKGTYETVAT